MYTTLLCVLWIPKVGWDPSLNQRASGLTRSDPCHIPPLLSPFQKPPSTPFHCLSLPPAQRPPWCCQMTHNKWMSDSDCWVVVFKWCICMLFSTKHFMSLLLPFNLTCCVRACVCGHEMVVSNSGQNIYYFPSSLDVLIFVIHLHNPESKWRNPSASVKV